MTQQFELSARSLSECRGELAGSESWYVEQRFVDGIQEEGHGWIMTYNWNLLKNKKNQKSSTHSPQRQKHRRDSSHVPQKPGMEGREASSSCRPKWYTISLSDRASDAALTQLSSTLFLIEWASIISLLNLFHSVARKITELKLGEHPYLNGWTDGCWPSPLERGLTCAT